MDRRLTPARSSNPVLAGQYPIKSTHITPCCYFFFPYNATILHLHFTLVLFRELDISHSIRSMWRECDCYPVDSHERFLWWCGEWSAVHSEWKCGHQVSWLWWGESASDGCVNHLNTTAYTYFFLCLFGFSQRQNGRERDRKTGRNTTNKKYVCLYLMFKRPYMYSYSRYWNKTSLRWSSCEGTSLKGDECHLHLNRLSPLDSLAS